MITIYGFTWYYSQPIMKKQIYIRIKFVTSTYEKNICCYTVMKTHNSFTVVQMYFVVLWANRAESDFLTSNLAIICVLGWSSLYISGSVHFTSKVSLSLSVNFYIRLKWLTEMTPLIPDKCFSTRKHGQTFWAELIPSVFLLDCLL